MGKTQIKSPFKFLDAYQHDDKHIFFGREQETFELYDRIFETNVVVLYGASGTGKTSLINCGLSNEFDAGDWLPVFIRRKDNIITSWREELRKEMVKKIDKDAPIADMVHSLYLDYFKPVFLIFDQFEELFILGDKQEQQIFFEKLDELLAANLKCKIIISMREEYIAHLSDYEYIIPSLFDNRIRLEKMSARNLKDVIIKTAEAFSIELSDKEKISELIVERLKDKNQLIDLATLQVYLDRLYRMDIERMEKRNEKRTVRFDEQLIEDTGDLENVMSYFLEEQLAIIEQDLAEEQKVTEKGIPLNILFALVTDNGTKQAVEIEEVKKQLERAKGIRPEVVDFCVDKFKTMRIIRELSE